MNETERFNWLHLWTGAVAMGLVTFAFLFLVSPLAIFGQASRQVTVLLGVVLVLLILGGAAWAYRRGRRELAIGLVGGYGLLALISGGECTMFVEVGAGEGAFRGFVGYPALMVVSFLVGLIVVGVRRLRSRGEEERP